MEDWVKQELGNAELRDIRRTARYVRTVSLLSESPGESVPDACKSWADTEGAYRLWSNGRVKPEALYEPHFRCTGRRAGLEKRVIVVQDGSSLDETSHKATKGLGYLENKHTRGLILHPSLVVTPSGSIVGLADMQVWARPLEELGKTKDRHSRPIFEKESYVWLLAWSNAQKRLPADVEVIGVADQEADIYELFAAPRRPGAHLVIRASGDRSVKHPARILSKAIREQPQALRFKLEVPRRPELPSRVAELTLRFAPLTLLLPTHACSVIPEVSLWAVFVEEQNPPAGAKPLQWLLLTTLPVATVEQALEVVSYYKRRWLIEQFFFILKQGCQVEKLQLESAEGMERALACYSVIAWRQLSVVQEVRLDPHGPADTLLAEHEWKALMAYHYPGRPLPEEPPTKREALRLIARLGGFLARKGDGEPGAKTIWKGMAHLHDLAEGFRLAARMT